MRPVIAETPSNVKSTYIRSICVIGEGRWGSSLATAISASSIPLLRPDSAEAQVYWLCVPDAQIEAATRQLVASHGSLRGRIVLHSSGVHGSELLQAAVKAGALTGSVHPLMSFPTRKPVSLSGVPFAVEASGRLRTRLFQLVRQLGGSPFAISREGKALYHASAVLASPLLVSLASATAETACLSGLSHAEAKRLLEPIMQATLTNYFRAGGAKSFSGPFARGDVETVSLHLAALRPHPLLGQLYRSLALHALDTLPVQNRAALEQALKPRRGTPSKPRMGQ